MLKEKIIKHKVLSVVSGLLALIVLVLILVVLQVDDQVPAQQQAEQGKQAVTFVAPPAAPLPAVNGPIQQGHTEVPNFAEITNVTARKVEFFRFLLPAARQENQAILAQRETLENLYHEKVLKGIALSKEEAAWLAKLSDYYKVDTQDRTRQFKLLLRRVDIVPETLVLIQAANESGWGTSRFALQARNFFGQWCWVPGCGLVPNQRPEGESYEVQLFANMESSVRAYIRNLNTHQAYHDLRSIRRLQRLHDKPMKATALAEGLISYSTRGEAYIAELQQMIRVNGPIIEAIRADLEESNEQGILSQVGS